MRSAAGEIARGIWLKRGSIFILTDYSRFLVFSARIERREHRIDISCLSPYPSLLRQHTGFWGYLGVKNPNRGEIEPYNVIRTLSELPNILQPQVLPFRKGGYYGEGGYEVNVYL